MEDQEDKKSQVEDIPCSAITSYFNVSHVPPKKRFDVWRESISCVFSVERNKCDRYTPFNANISATLFGEVLLARMNTDEQKWERTSQLMAKDGMDHFMLACFDSGSANLSASTTSFEQKKNSIVLYDLSQKLTGTTSQFSNLTLTIPRASIAPHIVNPDDQHLHLMTVNQPMVKLLCNYMRSLERNAGKLGFAARQQVGASITGLVIACLQNEQPLSNHTEKSVSRARLTLIRDYIEDNLNLPDLGPNHLIKQFALSRSKLYTMCAPFGGISSYIRERRCNRALMLLTSPANMEYRLHAIALNAGFSDGAALSKAFRKRYGYPPKEARRVLETPYEELDSQYNLDRRYERWINRLSL